MADNKKFHFDKLFHASPKPCGDSLVYQLGEMYCGGATDVAEHTQFCYEFTYVLDGKGTVFMGDSSAAVQKSDCCWSVPNETHRIVSDAKNPLRYCYVAYMTKDTDILNVHSLLFENDALPPAKRIFSDASLKDDFVKILSEISDEPPFVFSMIGLYLKIIVLKAFRSFKGSSIHNYNLDKNNPSYTAYQTANYIDGNILSMRNLCELETALHYNYQYLARNFAKTMNMTLNQYYINKKMEKAAELLSSAAMTVTRAAELLQYSSIHSFSRAFERFFGFSPKNYK